MSQRDIMMAVKFVLLRCDVLNVSIIKDFLRL